MKYMKNRSGVVLPFRQDLLTNPKLGFKLCDVGGKEIVVEEAPLEERLAARDAEKKAESAPVKKGNRKKSKSRG